MEAHGYRTFKNRGLGLNSPLKLVDGKVRYLHTHHLWDPAEPEDFLQGKDLWIESDR